MRLVAVAVVFILPLLLLSSGCDDPQANPPVPADRPTDRAGAEQARADPRVAAVASQFACPCGGCEHDQLLDCRCDMPRGAIETLTMIRTRLEAGSDVPQTIEYLTSLYPQARHSTPEPGLIRSSAVESE